MIRISSGVQSAGDLGKIGSLIESMMMSVTHYVLLEAFLRLYSNRSWHFATSQMSEDVP